MKILVLVSLLGCLGCTNVAGTLTSVPSSTNGVLTICPDAPLSITCSHNNFDSSVTRWKITGTTTQNCDETVPHGNPQEDMCGPFSIVMISNDTGSELNSTAQIAAAPETLDRAVVECLEGGGTNAKSVGTIIIQVVDPTPSTDSVTYSVESNMTGSLTIIVSSRGAYGTDVIYSGSVVGGSGSVQVMDNVLTVTGLDYTRNQNHTVNISGACSGILRSSQYIYIFNTAKLTISQLTPSIQCSIPSLPVTLRWDFVQETLSSLNQAVSLNPPIIVPSIISFSSVGGDIGTGSSSVMSYTQTNLTVGDSYSFTVNITNVAGPVLNTTSLTVSAFTVDISTVASQGCLTFTVSESCAENISLGDFVVVLLHGIGQCQSVTDFSNPMQITAPIDLVSGVCIPVGTKSIVEVCYTATLMYRNTAIMSQTNQDFRRCAVSILEAQLGEGVVFNLSSAVDSSGTVPHTTITNLECSDQSSVMLSGDSQALCVDSVWMIGTNSCKGTDNLIVIIIVGVAVFFFAVGIVVGILLSLFCGICIHGIQQKKGGTLLLVILLVFVFGLGIGILIGYCCVKNKKEKEDKEHLECQEIKPPPADSLYADPKSIEHEAAPGTEDQYAMVDRKVKKNTKPKPTPPEALYQDPNTIEHETAASGDTYAVVDKPKKSSKKKGGPDVVPPASEGLTYADIDLSSKRPKPGSGRQAPQQPGEYPKEHPVEYSSVDHGNTSQL